MVVVVPRLAEGDRGEPGQVARLIAGGERPAPEGMAERVDAEGHVVEEKDPDGAAPQQPGEPARDGAAQRESQAEGDGEADRGIINRAGLKSCATPYRFS